ncbi:hypothetical protein SAMN04488056_101263 [Cohaesibacter marisflavi]|uniref:Uncharacterized protein n=1 Tax=Cohaesibacter marisflavi TaxID=655353 RepID=A0A1I4ZXQ3_9HYPH|nr:hypothetical protein [Cohaesibacter marisflavi]SFN54936.1 hypothetical protein SAMN04488056_101263 [Cohaesibacter marisflavi]
MQNILPRQVIFLAFSLLLVVCGYLFLQRAPYGRAIFDFIFVQDGAYRISLGQVPHIDFFSPIGSLTLYLAKWGEALFPHSNAFVSLHIMTWLVLLPVFMALVPRFRSHTEFGCALLLLALITLVPMTLDQTHLSEISYFATYNRFATALLLLAGLWYMLPKSRFDAILLAYLLGLLFFLKITAFLVVCGILLASVILGRSRWTIILGGICLFWSLLLGLELQSGFISSYINDIHSMLSVNQGGAVYKLFYTAFTYWLAGSIVAFIGLAALARLLVFRKGRAFRWSAIITDEAYAIDTVLLMAAAFMAESQNTGGLGLIAGIACLFGAAAWERHKVTSALLLAATLFPVADMVVHRGMKVLVREKQPAIEQKLDVLIPGTRVPLPTDEGGQFFGQLIEQQRDRIRALQTDRFFLTYDPTSNAPAVNLAQLYAILDAARIFREKGLGDTVQSTTTIAFSDPFGRLLGLTPAKHTTLVMDIGRTLPEPSIEEARAYLASADGVFADLCNVTDMNITPYYLAALEQDFKKTHLNSCWDFYARRGE